MRFILFHQEGSFSRALQECHELDCATRPLLEVPENSLAIHAPHVGRRASNKCFLHGRKSFRKEVPLDEQISSQLWRGAATKIVSPPAQSLLNLVRDEYGVEYGAVNHLPQQLQATTHPALYDKKSWHEDTSVWQVLHAR